MTRYQRRERAAAHAGRLQQQQQQQMTDREVLMEVDAHRLDARQFQPLHPSVCANASAIRLIKNANHIRIGYLFGRPGLLQHHAVLEDDQTTSSSPLSHHSLPSFRVKPRPLPPIFSSSRVNSSAVCDSNQMKPSLDSRMRAARRRF